MDLNPDEAIAAGWLRETSVAARLLMQFMNYSLRRADEIVVLDRFMKERISGRSSTKSHISIIPPWSQSDVVQYSEKGRNSFRSQYGLTGKFVVMYSGNHSPCHPLQTLLDAAHQLSDRTDLAFCFIGGGSEHLKVREFARLHKLQNVLCLPYRPLNEVSNSLSAADLHVVVMGDPFVGIVHPSKVYNIVSIGGRILYIGPEESHVTDLAPYLHPNQLLATRHGDASKVATLILEYLEQARDSSVTQLERVGNSFHSKEVLVPQICGRLEATTYSDLTLNTPGIGEPVLRVRNEQES